MQNVDVTARGRLDVPCHESLHQVNSAAATEHALHTKQHLGRVYKLVHASRPEGGPDCIHKRHAGVDVADELCLALAGVCAILEEDNLGLLHRPKLLQRVEAGCLGTGVSMLTECNTNGLLCAMLNDQLVYAARRAYTAALLTAEYWLLLLPTIILKAILPELAHGQGLLSMTPLRSASCALIR